jgi:hypothetical protein
MNITHILKTSFFLTCYKSDTLSIPKSLGLFITILAITYTMAVFSRFLVPEATATEAALHTMAEYAFLLASAWTLVTIFRRKDQYLILAIAFIGIGLIGDSYFVLARLLLNTESIGYLSPLIIVIQLVGITRAVKTFFDIHLGIAISFAIVYFIGVIGLFGFISDINFDLPLASGYI